jgi:hypothetical protein
MRWKEGSEADVRLQLQKRRQRRVRLCIILIGLFRLFRRELQYLSLKYWKKDLGG